MEAIAVNQNAGSGTVQGSHAFAAGGIYTITVTLTDDDTGIDTAMTTAIITGRMIAYNWFDCDRQPQPDFINWAAGCVVEAL